MGRTQATYRMRLQAVRDRLLKFYPGNRSNYQQLWESAHQLSAPASMLPYGDTQAIATFCMVLEAFVQLDALEAQLDSSSSSEGSSRST